jgi:hypothetical protein
MSAQQDQSDIYSYGLQVAQALNITIDTEAFLPNPTKLAQEFFAAGNWKRLPSQDNKSVLDKNKPMSHEEKMRAYEDYYLPQEQEKPSTFYRFVDGEAQVVDDAGGFLCIAIQLNDLFKKNVLSEGLDDAKFLI